MNIVYRKVFSIINHQVSENQTHNIIFIPVSIYVFFFKFLLQTLASMWGKYEFSYMVLGNENATVSLEICSLL